MVMTTPRRTRARRPLALLLAAVAIACGEYARDNPYDPEAKVTFTIEGPDTAWTLLQTLEYTATVSPSVPGTEIEWASNDPTMLASRGGGTFQTTHTGVTAVVVRVGHHEQLHAVVIRQRAEQVFFRCAGGVCTVRIDGVGATRTHTVDQFDLLGERMEAGQQLGTVTYTVRNPAVASIVAGSAGPTSVQLRGVSAGSTWLVASMPSSTATGTWIDSIGVVVGSP
jgi:hypothetical protein